MAALSDQLDPSDNNSTPAGGASQPGKGLFGRSISGCRRLNVPRTWLVLFLVVAALLFCRQPHALIHPALFAEDGAIFFKQQYELGFIGALTTRYAGYPHLAPRIIAALCSPLPLEYVPLAYAIISLLVAAGTLTFFFAAGFRPIIDHDLLRAGVVIAFTLMPNAEPLMKVAYINWYMLLFSSLLLFYSLPKSTLACWCLFVPAAIAAWSNPSTILCLPVMLYRAWKAEGHTQRVWWIGLMLVTASFPFFVEHHLTKLTATATGQNSILLLLRAMGYRVFCFFFLGPMLTYPMRWENWPLVMLVSLALAVLCGVLAWRATVRTERTGLARLAPLFLFYLILALPTLFILRTEWLRFFVAWSADSWGGNDRYFFCPTLLLCVLAGVVYERLFSAWMTKGKLRTEFSLLLLLGWLTLQGFGFRLDTWHTKTGWPIYARQIRDAESKARQTGSNQVVHVESSFMSFDFDLVVGPAAKENH
jgi:hypothetical protein